MRRVTSTLYRRTYSAFKVIHPYTKIKRKILGNNKFHSYCLLLILMIINIYTLEIVEKNDKLPNYILYNIYEWILKNTSILYVSTLQFPAHGRTAYRTKPVSEAPCWRDNEATVTLPCSGLKSPGLHVSSDATGRGFRSILSCASRPQDWYNLAAMGHGGII